MPRNARRRQMPVSSSVLAPAGLARTIAAAYALPAPLTCQLLRSYVNDVYQVQTAATSYILKIYRAGWRTAGEVCYEVELLAHLRRQQVPVAAAVPCRDGRLVGELRAPEGPRLMVLFETAPGTKPPPPFTLALYTRFGQATAQLHTALDDFTSVHPRTPLECTYFLDRPLIPAAPAGGRPIPMAYFNIRQRSRTASGMPS